ncbi:heavy metal translocating P-type ATPase [Kribbella capetownensis]|uniref:Heavy metal translocating P-type ATPase n=1 Tax=Kribbella capetownensis TaxID=1572659 RepID=A0A4R0K8A8_9ACTN|nr:heavy metal translocating P-type ATPase [Kribbella capetownensis]
MRGRWWRRSTWSLPEVRWAATATGLFLAGLAAQLGGAPRWVSWPLFLACYASGGWEPGVAGLRALREKRLDVDLLMVAAAIGAAAIGQVLDGGLLIVIFATSGALEAIATKRTEDSVRGLLDLAPDTAVRIRPSHTDVDGEETVRVVDLVVGDVILVRPGIRIGADGTVVDGASEVDQATITGESMPVDKQPGDEVFAGTMNGSGALQVRVDRTAGESVVARIAALVAEATRTKAKTQLFVDKVEQRYSVGMVTATVALFVIPLLLRQPFTPTLLRAMTFMIVASPCAVVLATMPPLLAAIANAGRQGVLVKSAVVMELLGRTSQIALDKTGTLTRGTPYLARILTLPGSGLSEDEALGLAASAEHPSEHPLAAAIVAAARARQLPLVPVDAFAATAGQGVHATVRGREVRIGSPAGVRSSSTSAAAEALTALLLEGATVLVMTVDGESAAAFGMVDQLRPEAPDAVRRLTRLTERPPILLTGDNPTAARTVAAGVGIHDVRAGLRPDQKAEHVRRMQTSGAKVTVIGDGINDAPALAAADTGIAMGGAGSDLTLQTADAIIVRDNLSTVPAVIALSRRARRVVVANLIIAASFMTVLAVWDLAGHLPLPLGVAGHEGSTVIVGLNGLRLLRRSAWPRAGRTDRMRSRTSRQDAGRV